MITINTEDISLTTAPNQDIQGIFRISSEQGNRFRAQLFTDHPRIVTDLGEFTGREATIRYGIDVTGLHDGDHIDGRITIASDDGEYQLPVHVEICEEEPTDHGGRITSLHSFTDLAMRDFEEALRQFRSPYFETMIRTHEAQHLATYRALHVHPMTAQKLEEFLVLTGEKQPIEISVLRDHMEYYGLTDSIQETALLRRSTWGAVSLLVTTDADFIELPKTTLTDDDFVGSVADLRFVIHADRLGERKRFGELTISGSGRTLRILITASRYGKQHKAEVIAAKEELVNLTERYLTYLRNGKTDPDFLTVNRPRLQRLNVSGRSEAQIALMDAWLLHEAGMKKDRNLVLHLLKENDFSKADAESRAVFFYLSGEAGLISPERGRVAERIEKSFLRNPNSAILMKLYFLTNDDVKRMPYRRLETMRQVFESGCSSPFLYEEALSLLLEDESLLTSIDGLIRQVLYYAARREALTEGLALRAAFLSDNEKHYTEVMFRTLTLAYESYPYDGILEAICKLLMKGPSHDSRCFEWYAQAVEKNIRITRLYEYYIETIPESWQTILPLPVRKYFIYNDTLSDQKRAFVYANITRNRLEDPDTFEGYRDKIAAFTAHALIRQQMNADYAALYQEFIHRIPEGEADLMARLAFTAQVFCDDESVRSVVVVHKHLEEEEVRPLLHGTALIHLYTEDAAILFEDSRQRRFRDALAYSVEPLMDASRYQSEFEAAGCLEKGYILNRLQDGLISADNCYLWKEVSDSPEFTDEYRLEARRKLLSFYEMHNDDYEVIEAVRSLDDVCYAEADKVGLVEVLLAHGLYERAFHLLTRYGAEGVEDSQLVRLISRMIETYDGEEHEELLLLSEVAFRRGKFDERILSYLIRYYHGAFQDMAEIRQKAEEFYVETWPMDERLIRRCVECHLVLKQGSKILRHYAEQGGRTNLIFRYIRMEAGYLFDHDGNLDEYLAKTIREFTEQEHADRLMKLMLLKYDSTLTSLTASQEEEADQLMEEFVRQNLRMGYFKNFPASLTRPYQLEDKVFVEQYAKEGDRLTLFYRIDSGDEASSGAYRREPMKAVFRGLHQRIFTLFYGERLTYYIEIVRDDQTIKTEVTTKQNALADLKGRSRYQLINQMLKASSEGNETLLGELMGDYLKTERMMKTLFRLEEES